MYEQRIQCIVYLLWNDGRTPKIIP